MLNIAWGRRSGDTQMEVGSFAPGGGHLSVALGKKHRNPGEGNNRLQMFALFSHHPHQQHGKSQAALPLLKLLTEMWVPVQVP